MNFHFRSHFRWKKFENFFTSSKNRLQILEGLLMVIFTYDFILCCKIANTLLPFFKDKKDATVKFYSTFQPSWLIYIDRYSVINIIFRAKTYNPICRTNRCNLEGCRVWCRWRWIFLDHQRTKWWVQPLEWCCLWSTKWFYTLMRPNCFGKSWRRPGSSFYSSKTIELHWDLERQGKRCRQKCHCL